MAALILIPLYTYCTGYFNVHENTQALSNLHADARTWCKHLNWFVSTLKQEKRVKKKPKRHALECNGIAQTLMLPHLDY